MKNIAIALVILIVGIGAILSNRYQVVVYSPIVAKIDRLTGDVWIVNSGMWRKVGIEQPHQPMMSTPIAQTVVKTK